MSTTISVPTLNQLRVELGDFSSIVCLKAIVVGVEDSLGEKAATIALVSAGQARGKQLATDLNLNSMDSLEHITAAVSQALGREGTRLCLVDKIVEEEDGYKVYCRETFCSAGEPQGSNRQLTFTLGAMQGVLEQVTGKRLRGKQTESVLRGGSHDVITFKQIGQSSIRVQNP